MASSDEKTRIAIIGIGGAGTYHARYILRGEVPDAELTAVCDIDTERLAWARQNLHESLQTFETGGALFAAGAADAVIIATPHYFHPPYVIQALQNGLHALTEKPAGVYTRQVREMNETARKSDRVFAIMFNQRTQPLYRKLKDLVESGELGEIRRTNWIITNWFRSQSYYDAGGWRATWAGEGGGVLINQCPHNLDLWQWTCGMPRRLRAFCYFGKYHHIEVEDDVTAYVEYENGATGLFVTTTGEAPGTDRLEVTGDNGKVVLEGGRLTFWRTRQPVSRFSREYKGGFGSPETWRVEVPTGGPGEEHVGITRNWVKAIREGAPLIAPGTEGIRSLQLSNAMLLSAWTDSWVEIPVDEELFYEKLQERIRSSTFQKSTVSDTVMDIENSL